MAEQRQNWLHETSGTPIIDQYAAKLTTYMEALEDGKIDESELKSQEQRVIDLMKEIEPQLDDDLHATITRLLCELTAFDIMQILHTIQHARPTSRFQG